MSARDPTLCRLNNLPLRDSCTFSAFLIYASPPPSHDGEWSCSKVTNHMNRYYSALIDNIVSRNACFDKKKEQCAPAILGCGMRWWKPHRPCRPKNFVWTSLCKKVFKIKSIQADYSTLPTNWDAKMKRRTSYVIRHFVNRWSSFLVLSTSVICLSTTTFRYS